MEQKLSVIMASDVVGYSRLMGIDERGTLSALKKHRHELLDVKIAVHQGRTIKLIGDGMLAEFRTAEDAVLCAVEIQREMRTRNSDIPRDRRIEFRIGINIGDILFEDDDVYGDGVNVAARIENIAKPGGIAVSSSVRDTLGNRLGIGFEDAGEQTLKNIDRPLRIFNILIDGREAAQSEPAFCNRCAITQHTRESGFQAEQNAAVCFKVFKSEWRSRPRLFCGRDIGGCRGCIVALLEVDRNRSSAPFRTAARRSDYLLHLGGQCEAARQPCQG